MLAIVGGLPVAWNVPPLAASRPTSSRAAVRMLGGFELPKLDLGGIQFEEGKETTTMLKPADGDVQFTDRDGDVITLKSSRTNPGKVDYYNGDVMKIKDATMVQQGEVRVQWLSHILAYHRTCRRAHPTRVHPLQGIVLTGYDRTDFKFKFFNGNFRVEIDELAVPRDPMDVERAMALVSPTAQPPTTSASPPAEVAKPIMETVVGPPAESTVESVSDDAGASPPSGSYAEYLAQRSAVESTQPPASVVEQPPAVVEEPPAVIEEPPIVVTQAPVAVVEAVGDDTTYEPVDTMSAGSLPMGFHRGLCAAGDDVYEADMTLEEARAYCDSNPECLGFTYNAVEQEPAGVVHIWFKSHLNLIYDESWFSYSNGRSKV